MITQLANLTQLLLLLSRLVSHGVRAEEELAGGRVQVQAGRRLSLQHGLAHVGGARGGLRGGGLAGGERVGSPPGQIIIIIIIIIINIIIIIIISLY